ncbi:MAG: sodium-dependent transporter [Sphaerochaeta sp.]|jgi:NSS family neurotransmitter:Na+ symporter|nr:sodium-dependent transporter [Sphaerochaeta sp.]MCH3919401.1 sodium-dependent transporter [Sphaerochaeta sp.]MCI2045355.1 sodium-dependent transporter [Sphaerochaeta sp.]MCI2075965.1 sodium-dependent transporter [Sphaerochaeta sp.]MCI2096949.1 sodium-dependent transporter [Sphaerochaeta sp.]
MESQRETLSSRLGFILLSAGCAIGLGNVWRFPYITGTYGGATFVLIYLLFLVIFGLPIMVMEFAIGRASRQNIGLALKTLEPPGTQWHRYGPFAIAANYLLMMYYTPISGWLLSYFFHSVDGSLSHLSSAEVSTSFTSMLSDPWSMLAWTSVVIILGFFINSRGLQKGVESITKVMMVCLLLLIILLAVNSMFLEGGSEGIAFYLKPNLSHIRQAGLFNVVFAAMNQAFFTLSLGIGSMEIFGSYIGKERSLTGEATRVIILDTAVALLAGLIIFPACSAFGVKADAGPSLLFITLPNIFSQMPAGRFWGSLFFLFMSFAAFSTVIAVFENIISYWIDVRHVPRKRACRNNAIAMVLLSLPCILGFNAWSGFTPFGAGTGVLDLEDFIVSSTLLPIGSLLFCLFCTRKIGWGWDNFLQEADQGTGLKFPRWARFWVRWGIPALFVVIFIKGYLDILVH